MRERTDVFTETDMLLLRVIIATASEEDAQLLRFVLPEKSTDDIRQVVVLSERILAVDHHVRFIHPDVPDASAWPRARRMLTGLRRLAITQSIERIVVAPAFLSPRSRGEIEKVLRERKAWALTDEAIVELNALNLPAARQTTRR